MHHRCASLSVAPQIVSEDGDVEHGLTVEYLPKERADEIAKSYDLTMPTMGRQAHPWHAVRASPAHAVACIRMRLRA